MYVARQELKVLRNGKPVRILPGEEVPDFESWDPQAQRSCLNMEAVEQVEERNKVFASPKPINKSTKTPKKTAPAPKKKAVAKPAKAKSKKSEKKPHKKAVAFADEPDVDPEEDHAND